MLNMVACTVVILLVEEVLCRFGIPWRVHDNADGLSRIQCRQCNIPGHGDYSNQCMQIGPARQTMKYIKLTPKEDEEMSKVRTWVKDKDKPLFQNISARSYAMKSIWNQFQRLEIQDGLLVRRIDHLEDGSLNYQALNPRYTRRLVLKCCYYAKTSGHLGIKTTLRKVRQRLYWPCYNQKLCVRLRNM